MLYALLDGSAVIRLEHLQAALAIWRYCEESARLIFGDKLGDPDADVILGGTRGGRRARHHPHRGVQPRGPPSLRPACRGAGAAPQSRARHQLETRDRRTPRAAVPTRASPQPEGGDMNTTSGEFVERELLPEVYEQPGRTDHPVRHVRSEARAREDGRNGGATRRRRPRTQADPEDLRQRVPARARLGGTRRNDRPGALHHLDAAARIRHRLHRSGRGASHRRRRRRVGGRTDVLTLRVEVGTCRGSRAAWHGADACLEPCAARTVDADRRAGGLQADPGRGDASRPGSRHPLHRAAQVRSEPSGGNGKSSDDPTRPADRRADRRAGPAARRSSAPPGPRSTGRRAPRGSPACRATS